MKTRFLFPNQFKNFGWLLFIPSVLATLIISALNISTNEYLNISVFSIYQDSIGEIPGFFKFIKNSIVDEILTIGIIVGGILVGFSKLKEEDEMISKIRYESLVWATYLNYAIILFFTLFIFGLPYLNVLFYNMFTLLLFFIIRFHFMIYKLNIANYDE
jgi:hypothetical protein